MFIQTSVELKAIFKTFTEQVTLIQAAVGGFITIIDIGGTAIRLCI